MMRLTLLILLVISSRSFGWGDDDDDDTDDQNIKKMPKELICRPDRRYKEPERHVLLYEVLPGRGWDNLRNVEMGQVWEFNFTKCKMSGDGKYILPLSVQLLPRRYSTMQLFSEVFSSFEQYSSLTAASINMAGHGDLDGKVQVSGSFSAEKQKVKVTQINTRSLTTRVQMRHVFYTALQEPDTPLTKGFRDRLLDIIYEIEENNKLYAQYLADMVVAEYGTHYVASIDAGGVYASLDFIRSDQNSMSESQMNTLKQDAAVNFEKVAGFNRSIGYQNTKNSTKEYMKNLTDSSFVTDGGPAMGPQGTADEWVKGIWRNLAAVDRQGAPLFYAISRATLGSIKLERVTQVRRLVKEAVERYYRANTVIGCMERSSPNFNMLANVPSEDCEATHHNFTFGGVFQTCTGPEALCKEVRVANPMTGEMKCSAEFDQVPLWTRIYKCDGCSGKSSCPPGNCANYNLFWCASRRDGSNRLRSFLFGGVFNSIMSNPLTGSQSCPPNFFPLKMGSSGLQVCLSRDFELGMENAFEFGGFFSCISGNPYTMPVKNKQHPWTYGAYLTKQSSEKWPQQCPPGFAQHMADIDGTCEIMYCLRNKALRQATRAYANRPPFVKIPDGVESSRKATFHSLEKSMSSSSETWVRDPQTNTWSYAAVQQPPAPPAPPAPQADKVSESEKPSDGGKIAAITFSVIGSLCVALGIAAFILLRHRRQSALQGTSNPVFNPSPAASPEPVNSDGDQNTRV